MRTNTWSGGAIYDHQAQSKPTNSSGVKQATSSEIAVLIVDDHALIRENWSYILDHDPRFSVVGGCGTGEEAIELARKLRPHVVLMDINMPGINGLEATNQIRKYAPGTRIIGVSLHSQPAYARKMMQNGASGYVTKNSSRMELFRAILEVREGKRYICDEIKNILSEQIITEQNHSTGIEYLSAREIEIISGVKKGCSSKEIAEQLHISVKTVEVHRYNILKKLNLKNAAALVNFIHHSGLQLD